MSKDDLISRKIAIGILGNSPEETCMPWGEVERMLRALPDVDAVTVVLGELVMCKNCKHCYFASNRVPAEKAHVCSIFGHDVALDFYCKNGERRDDDATLD